VEISQVEQDSAAYELRQAIARFKPHGDVLELACGPGTFTAELAGYAETLTAVDASPEMLALARALPGTERVRFIEADLFAWSPDRRYDCVFFGFWLSHVPLERFARFWAMVRRCLRPEGRVMFVDDAYRTPDELIEGEASSTIMRTLTDGSKFRAVKVPHTPEELSGRLARAGWDFEIRRTAGPFFYGTGRPAAHR
jgi:demethylmenaquinone methyltransferase/2-methoxy-6-polyprenyl-1,4-benzoquinol methylase